jgi:hypothetical protein
MEQISMAMNDQGQILIVAFKTDTTRQEVVLTEQELQTIAGYPENQREDLAIAIARSRLN